MTERVNVNGRIAAAEDAVVSPLDRGFLFGDGVYETIRTYHGRTFLVGPHLDRLRRSAARLAIPWPVAPSDLSLEIDRTLAAAGNPESAVRVVLTRGRGPLTYDTTGCGAPTVVIHVRPCPDLPHGARAEGVDVAIVGVQRNAPAALDPAIKANNLLNNLMAWQEARRLGAFEPLLLNADGRLAEGATSNFFLVQEGRLVTPSLDEGLLEGITRGVVLDLARHHGIEVREEPVSPDRLGAADEAFLTSTLKGVLPVRRCDGWPIRTGRPGPVTRRMIDLYDALIEAETKAGSAPDSSLR